MGHKILCISLLKHLKFGVKFASDEYIVSQGSSVVAICNYFVLILNYIYFLALYSVMAEDTSMFIYLVLTKLAGSLLCSKDG